MQNAPAPASAPLEMRDSPSRNGFCRMNTAEIRAAFLIEDLFLPDRLRMIYWHTDRAVLGTAVPGRNSIPLPGCRELASSYFTQRRELGIVNIGGGGRVRIGADEIFLEKTESAYIGKGNPDIQFFSNDAANPAQFYFVSYPAQIACPSTKVAAARIESTECGDTVGANRRTINKLIHPAGISSCQLTMGYTRLSEGSVWNTMPAHTHLRRSEIYLYFDLPKDALVVHCLGEPHETKHILVRDRQAVLSPPWSLHFGAGTTSYSFIWSMGGENQEFSDMDAVPMNELK